MAELRRLLARVTENVFPTQSHRSNCVNTPALTCRRCFTEKKKFGHSGCPAHFAVSLTDVYCPCCRGLSPCRALRRPLSKSQPLKEIKVRRKEKKSDSPACCIFFPPVQSGSGSQRAQPSARPVTAGSVVSVGRLAVGSIFLLYLWPANVEPSHGACFSRQGRLLSGGRLKSCERSSHCCSSRAAFLPSVKS